MKRIKKKLKSQPRQMLNGLRQFVITLMLVVTLAILPATGFEPGLTGYAAAETVQVDQAELDSLFAGVDSLLLERRLLQIELEDVRRKAEIESVLCGERLKLREGKDTWIIRVMKSSTMDVIFFVAGVYVGANAVQSVR